MGRDALAAADCAAPHKLPRAHSETEARTLRVAAQDGLNQARAPPKLLHGSAVEPRVPVYLRDGAPPVLISPTPRRPCPLPVATAAGRGATATFVFGAALRKTKTRNGHSPEALPVCAVDDDDNASQRGTERQDAPNSAVLRHGSPNGPYALPQHVPSTRLAPAAPRAWAQQALPQPPSMQFWPPQATPWGPQDYTLLTAVVTAGNSATAAAVLDAWSRRAQ